jgi:hypothetical protein
MRLTIGTVFSTMPALIVLIDRSKLRLKSHFLPLFVICAMPLLGSAQQPSTGIYLQKLHGHVPRPAGKMQAVDRLPGTNRLDLAIALPLRNQEQLAILLEQIHDPASTNYRHYLTPEQFAKKFGPTEEDYQALVAFVRRNGLTVTATHPNRVLLDVSGSVSDVEKALGVTMRRYRHPTENRDFYAPDTEPSLSLDVPVLHISGLDNYALPHPRYKISPVKPPPNAMPQVGSGPGGGYLGNDFRAAYVPDSSLTGSGQVVGLLEFDGYSPDDIAYYETLAGLPNVAITNVLLDGFSGVPTGFGGEVEVSLDIQMVIAMAPGISGIIVYEAGPDGNWHDMLNRMATDNLAQQLSCSWYIPGGPADPVADGIFQQMAAQGQSFFNASGDEDAYPALIDFPGDSPYITQVGGTTLTTAIAGGSWTSETVWNRGNGIGSGGGISTQYPIPYWQTNVSMALNQGSTTMRNTPDVALTAEQVYVRADDGVDYSVGGTSCAAPLWAAFMALANQQAAATGRPSVGFANSAIYGIGSQTNYSSAFHDITTGSNTNGASPNKFFATSGYDLSTGWGTPAGQRLINALADPDPLFVAPQAGFSSMGGVGGPFTVTSITLTLTNSGTNSLSWSLTSTAPWLDVSPGNGVLALGGPAVTVTASLNAGANLLALGTYVATVWFTNLNDNVGQSRQFTLAVISPPVFTVQPADQVALDGARAIFTAGVGGGLPRFYQWQINSNNLTDGGKVSGSATGTLTISNVAPADEAFYRLIVTNAAGMAISADARLTALPGNVDHFVWSPVSSPQMFNVPFPAGIVAYDPAGIVATNFNGTVRLGAKAFGSDANDTFDRPDSGDLGGDWTVQTGAWRIETNQARSSTNLTMDLALFNTASSNGTISADIFYTGNPRITYCALVAGFSNVANNVFVKLQDDTGSGSFNAVYFYYGNNGGPWPGMTGGASSLAVTPFTQARVTLLLSNNFAILEIDRNFDGTPENVITRGGLPAASLGYGAGLGGFNNATFDNFHVGAGWQPIAINPSNSGAFANGVWAGSIALFQSATNVVLTADDGAGHSGTGNPFDVIYSNQPPFIVLQPVNQSVYAGFDATFTVTAFGSPPLSFQWALGGAPIPGATNPVYQADGVQLVDSGSQFNCVVSNAYGSISSSNGVLTVLDNGNLVAYFTDNAQYMGENPTTTGLAGPITAANLVPLQIVDIATANLSGLGWLMINDQASALSPALASRLKDIQAWVALGGKLIVHDTGIGQNGNNPFLFGTSNIISVTFYTSDVDVIPPGSNTVVAGPFGIINNTTLDGGQYSAFGYVPESQLPVNAYPILSMGGNPTNVVAFSYPFGAGEIFYSTIPLYCFLAGGACSNNQIAPALRNIYVPNVLAYMAGPVPCGNCPPTVFLQPVDVVILTGNAATFAASANGTPPLSFQWTINGSPITGATATSYTATNVPLGFSGSQFVCVASNPYGATSSQAATLTVLPLPSISQQPAGLNVLTGSNVTFTIGANGAPPLSYQWSRNGSPIAGATATSCTINFVQLTDSGSLFSCLVSNPYGTVNSASALLTVVTPAANPITFDDLPSPGTGSQPVPSGYRGFIWGNFFYQNGISTAGMVSASNVAFNGYGSNAFISNAAPFNLISAYATAEYYDNLQLTVLGSAGGTLRYSNTFTLNPTAPSLLVFNYNAVTRVDFSSSGGTLHAGFFGGGPEFVLDNVGARTNFGTNFDHFVWSAIPATQQAGAPFQATITAVDSAGAPVTSFNGTAAISASGGGVSLYQYDFETGLQGFIIDNTYGSGNGLWHLTTARSLDGGHSPTNSLYYGHNEGPGGGGRYDTGTANGGVITSPALTLPPGTLAVSLSYRYLLDVEARPSGDVAFIEVTTNGGATYAPVASKNSAGLLTNWTSGTWVPNIADLSAYAGQTIKLRYRFDTIDALDNDTEGWYLDDIALFSPVFPVAVSPVITGPFSNGAWTGNIIVSKVATNAVLLADGGSGRIGASNPFQVVSNSGVNIDHFAWSAISSTQQAGVPFPATITALSSWGSTATNFYVTAGISATAAGDVLYQYNFESGLQGFTINNSYGSSNGLWHLSSGRAADAGHSPSNSLYYGHNETLAGGGNYDTGSANGGVVVSPPLTLPAGVPAVTLSFNYLMNVESYSDYDVAFVEISTNNGTTFAPIAVKDSLGGLTNLTAGLWVADTLDISAFAGQTIRLRFRFDTIDGYNNDTEGWYVDDITFRSFAFSVAVAPGNTGLFMNGGWSGNITMLQAATNVVLWANDGIGHSGASNPFQVIAAAAPPLISQVALLPDGSIQFILLGSAGDVYQVMASTNLLNWQNIASVTNIAGSVLFSDFNATNFNRRFYRLERR